MIVMGQSGDDGLAVKQLPAEGGPLRDLTLQLAPGRAFGQAAGNERVVDVFELRRPFLDDLAFAIRRQRKRRHLLAHQAVEVPHGHTPAACCTACMNVLQFLRRSASTFRPSVVSR